MVATMRTKIGQYIDPDGRLTARGAYAHPRVLDAIYGAARGRYQAALLVGDQTWSGSTLRGTARDWGTRYATSRSNLVDRIYKRLPRGWYAYTCLVREDNVYRRRLVLETPSGKLVRW